MEMYLAGVSVRRVEDITEALWGTRVIGTGKGTPRDNLHFVVKAFGDSIVLSKAPLSGDFIFTAV